MTFIKLPSQNLGPTYRPYFTPANQPNSIDLSATDTIKWALKQVGMTNGSNVNLNLASGGVYELDRAYLGLNFLSLNGNTSVEETRNITAVDSTNTTDGLIFDIDGTTLTNNQWFGRRILFSGSPVNGRYGEVYRNVGNKLYVNLFYDSTMPTVTTSNTISLIAMNSQVEYVGASGAILASTGLFFNLCRMVGDGQGRVLFGQATDKIEFANCDLEMNRMNAAFARMDLRGCNIMTKGDTTAGLLTVPNSGAMMLEGCAFLGDKNASVNERRIDVNLNGALLWRGMNTFRSLEEIRSEGGNSYLASPSGFDNFILLEDGAGASCSTFLNANVQGQGSCGMMRFPKVVGSVTDALSVKARLAAKIFLGASTSITDATGTNTVSADNGSTSGAPVQSHADGTYIAIA